MVQSIDKFQGDVQKGLESSIHSVLIDESPKCVFAGTKADFYIGLMGANPDTDLGRLDPISIGMVEKAIVSLLGKGFGEVTWPVLYDLNKQVLYHSFEAHQNGLSATQGWMAYCVKNNIVDWVPTLE